MLAASNRRGGGRTRTPARRASVLAEDRLFELLECRAGLDAELLDENRACRAVDAERFVLATRAVQGKHQLRLRSFGKRLLGDHPSKFGDHELVPAEGEIGIDPIAERRPAELVEPLRLVPELARSADAGQRRPSPESESITQQCGGGQVLITATRGVGILDEAGELSEIRLGSIQAELIGMAPCQE